MSMVHFKQGEYNAENLQKIIQSGGERVEDTYILPDGGICYLKGDRWVPMDQLKFITAEQAKYIAEKVLEKSVQKKTEEGFPNLDSKSVMRFSSEPLIYDLETRIKEINGDIELPLEQIERIMERYDVEQADELLRAIFPNGFKLGPYSEESMREWERQNPNRERIDPHRDLWDIE